MRVMVAVMAAVMGAPTRGRRIITRGILIGPLRRATRQDFRAVDTTRLFIIIVLHGVEVMAVFGGVGRGCGGRCGHRRGFFLAFRAVLAIGNKTHFCQEVVSFPK